MTGFTKENGKIVVDGSQEKQFELDFLMAKLMTQYAPWILLLPSEEAVAKIWLEISLNGVEEKIKKLQKLK